MNSKVYHLEVTQHKYHDGWREGGHYTEVTRIPASGGVPEGELKNLVRKFISDEVNKPDCGLVFERKHVCILSYAWDDSIIGPCSAEALTQAWNHTQPKVQIKILSEDPYPLFPINMKIAKDRKKKYCWAVQMSKDGGCIWETLRFFQDAKEAQEFYLGNKVANPNERFSLVHAQFEKIARSEFIAQST